MKESWKNELRRRFEDYQKPAPGGLWEQIESQLDVAQDVNRQVSTKNVVRWRRRIIAVVAATCALLLTITQLFINIPENAESRKASDNHEASSAVKASKIGDNQKRSIGFSTTEEKFIFTAKTETRQYKPEHQSTQTKRQTKIEERTNKPGLKSISENKTKNITDSTGYHSTDKPVEQNPLYKGSNLLASNETAKNKKKRRWHISLSASKLPDRTNSHKGYGELSIGSRPTNIPDNAVWGEDPMTDILLYNRNIATHTRIRHKFPIRAGISLKYDFNVRFGIEGGLEYTYLSSEMVSGSDNYRYETDQELHFIGFSLKGCYSIWNNKHWDLYLTAGGTVEKCIHGKAETEYILANTKTSADNVSVSIDEPQWSINASAGIQYNLTNTVGIYAEPGASYFFNNDAPVENIYKDKPLNFNLRFGIRFTLK